MVEGVESFMSALYEEYDGNILDNLGCSFNVEVAVKQNVMGVLSNIIENKKD
jgi:hypothetical protein